MIDINSQAVSNCGFPEEYLFWLMMIFGIATPVLAFVLSEHTKEKYGSLAFISIILALFSDRFFDEIGKVGFLYRICFWLSVCSGVTLFMGVEYGLLDCSGNWKVK